MPVNPDLVGRVFQLNEVYSVGRETVRDFAAAVRSDCAASLSVTAARSVAFADLVAPPTFPVLLQQRVFDVLLAEPDLGFDIASVVHGEQRFEYDRPIVAGDELHVSLEVTELKSLGATAMLTAETSIKDAGGNRVATARSLLVIRTES